jgi:hypothetical protein
MALEGKVGQVLKQIGENGQTRGSTGIAVGFEICVTFTIRTENQNNAWQ